MGAHMLDMIALDTESSREMVKINIAAIFVSIFVFAVL